MKKISGVSCPRTDHVRSSKATDQGLCELGGGRNLLNLLNVNTNQRQTFLRICCFNAQSVGTSEKRTNTEHFAVNEQIDILFITETWLRCQGDEAKCVDMTPPGYSMKSFPRSTRGGGVGLHCERHFLSCYRCCVFLVQSLVF